MVVNRGVFAMVEMQRRCSHDWRCGAGRGGAAMSARKYCVWIKGGRDEWITDCETNHYFEGMDSGPGKNGFIYCPYCGGRLASV